MSADFERLLLGLKSGKYRIELDIPAPQVSIDLIVASQLAWQREESIRAGQRVARVYNLESPMKDASRPNEHVSVSEHECGELLDAGATWSGPGHLNPRP